MKLCDSEGTGYHVLNELIALLPQVGGMFQLRLLDYILVLRVASVVELILIHPPEAAHGYFLVVAEGRRDKKTQLRNVCWGGGTPGGVVTQAVVIGAPRRGSHIRAATRNGLATVIVRVLHVYGDGVILYHGRVLRVLRECTLEVRTAIRVELMQFVLGYCQNKLIPSNTRQFKVQNRSIARGLEDPGQLIDHIDALRGPLQAHMKNVSVLRPEEDLEKVTLLRGLILNVNAAEGFWLLRVAGLGHNLEDTCTCPVIIEYFMLGQEEAVQAHRVHVHLLYGFSLQNVIVNLGDLGVSIVTHGLQGGFPEQVTALGQYPHVPVLHLCELELYNG